MRYQAELVRLSETPVEALRWPVDRALVALVEGFLDLAAGIRTEREFEGVVAAAETALLPFTEWDRDRLDDDCLDDGRGA